MRDKQITLWSQVDDSTIAEWTDVDLIRNVDYELRQSSRLAYRFGQGLARGDVDFASEEQSRTLRELQEQLNQVYEAACWMTVWIFAQVDRRPNLKLKLTNEQEVVPWSPLDLIQHVHCRLLRSLPRSLELASRLTLGEYGFSNDEQEETLKLIQSRIERISVLNRWLTTWLDARGALVDKPC